MPSKNKGKADGGFWTGSYSQIPHCIQRTEKYTRLSSWAVKLLVDLLIQKNGWNNGDLSAAWSLMQHRGWRSKSTLHEATKELLEVGFIVLTRQGGRNKCSLYGVTWDRIEKCPDKRTGKSKLDHQPAISAPGYWRDDYVE